MWADRGGVVSISPQCARGEYSGREEGGVVRRRRGSKEGGEGAEIDGWMGGGWFLPGGFVQKL